MFNNQDYFILLTLLLYMNIIGKMLLLNVRNVLLCVRFKAFRESVYCLAYIVYRLACVCVFRLV
jgi:hypothetical protein